MYLWQKQGDGSSKFFVIKGGVMDCKKSSMYGSNCAFMGTKDNKICNCILNGKPCLKFLAGTDILKILREVLVLADFDPLTINKAIERIQTKTLSMLELLSTIYRIVILPDSSILLKEKFEELRELYTKTIIDKNGG